jgi:hypothetical protein
MTKPLPDPAGSTDSYLEAMAELEGWNIPPEAEMLEDMVTDHIFWGAMPSSCDECTRPSYEHSLV